jgi:hypothetical protein
MAQKEADKDNEDFEVALLENASLKKEFQEAWGKIEDRKREMEHNGRWQQLRLKRLLPYNNSSWQIPYSRI